MAYKIEMTEKEWKVESKKSSRMIIADLYRYICENTLESKNPVVYAARVSKIYKKNYRVLQDKLIRFDCVIVKDFHRDCTCCVACTCPEHHKASRVHFASDQHFHS